MGSVINTQPAQRRIPPISQRRTLELRRAEYRRKVLGIPTDVDRWLTANLRCGGNVLFLVDVLKLADVADDSVRCVVERTTIKHPTLPITHSLFITATANSTKSMPLNVQASPRAVLDRYEGDADKLSAPDWVRSEKIRYTFDQPRMTFATFFARLACHDINNNQRGLYHRMVEWAYAIIVEFLPTPGPGPLTPDKVRILRNRQPHKPRRSLALNGAGSATPVKGKGNKLSSGEGSSDSGSDSYNEVEALTFD